MSFSDLAGWISTIFKHPRSPSRPYLHIHVKAMSSGCGFLGSRISPTGGRGDVLVNGLQIRWISLACILGEGRQVLNSDRDPTRGTNHISSGPLEDVDNHPGLLS